MSKDLKRRGFRFVGSTICYAFMQAMGMVNDHARDCFRFRNAQSSIRPRGIMLSREIASELDVARNA